MSSGPHGLEVGSPGLIWREWVSPPRHVLQLKTATVPELDRGAQQWQAKDVLAVGASLTPARQVRPGCRTSVSASLGLRAGRLLAAAVGCRFAHSTPAGLVRRRRKTITCPGQRGPADRDDEGSRNLEVPGRHENDLAGD